MVNGMKCRAEIDRHDRVPLCDRKIVDRRHMLDAGLVDEKTDLPGACQH